MGDGFRVLHLVRPFLRILPEVESADRKVPFRERVIYKVIALFIFLVCSQLPLYGIHSTTGADPFYWMRVILASSRGTIMELGITPLVTSGMVMQLPGGSKIIKVDNNLREDRALIMVLCLGILIAVGRFAYVVSECMMNYSQKDMDLDLVSPLHCHQYLAFTPTTINAGRGPEFEGAVIALFHLLITRDDKVQALREAFCRQNLPNVLNLISTLFIFGIVNYLQGLRVLLNVKSRNARGQQGSYPIKLFYSSNMPIILQSALVSNLYFISQLLYRRFNGSFIVNLLGKWKESEYAGGQFTPVAGLAYYITAPSSFGAIAANPFHALFYLIFMLSACALFSKTWIEVSGSSARDVARQLREQQMIMPGHEMCRAYTELLYSYAAGLLGVCIGGLTLLAI
ncbi:hypothetical protein Scep_011716 [Stephania cephalantha]|uniref:Translocon Sec61/SecY plug domain-containing protein n=1 Tax=Stephania cephalantha TaxID=152367 RepID=A0AAP0P644_9MAGN